MSAILHGLKRGFAKYVHCEFTGYYKLGCPFPQSKVFMEGEWYSIFWEGFLKYFKYFALLF